MNERILRKMLDVGIFLVFYGHGHEVIGGHVRAGAEMPLQLDPAPRGVEVLDDEVVVVLRRVGLAGPLVEVAQRQVAEPACIAAAGDNLPTHVDGG